MITHPVLFLESSYSSYLTFLSSPFTRFVIALLLLCHSSCAPLSHRLASSTQHIASFVIWGFVYIKALFAFCNNQAVFSFILKSKSYIQVQVYIQSLSFTTKLLTISSSRLVYQGISSFLLLTFCHSTQFCCASNNCITGCLHKSAAFAGTTRGDIWTSVITNPYLLW